jgi:hypothetical protein
MQLIRQLKDEELTDVLLDSEEADIRTIFSAVPLALQSASERPGWFWQRQLARVRGRIANHKPSAFRPLAAWAGALALFFLAFSLVRNSPAPKPVQGQSDSDQELMVAVEQAVETEGPASLEPAALLADEIGSAQPTTETRHILKENRHEN